MRPSLQILFPYFKRHFISLLRTNHRACLVILLIFSCAGAYISYVPYDFTIGALSSIYDRCFAEKIRFNIDGAFDFQRSGNGTDCNDSNARNFSIFTSRPPWISIVGRKMVSYSAFYLENYAVVRVLVLKHTGECRPVACYFHTNGALDHSMLKESIQPSAVDLKHVSLGTYDLIRLDCWSGCDFFESFYIDCPIRSVGKLNSIAAVSVIPIELMPCVTRDVESLNAWPRTAVTTIPSEPHHQHELAICIPPLFNWVDALKLVLFVEYYRRQGATRFLLCHRSWSADVQRVVAHYLRQSDISFEIIEWPLLPPSVADIGEEINILNKHISYNGQVLAMNECGLRERGRSRFVAQVDLDEFIFTFPDGNKPGLSRGHSTLLNLLNSMDTAQTGSFVFGHVWVYSDLAPALREQVNESAQNLLHVSASSLLREPGGRIDHFPSRTKTVIKPEAVLKQGVHFTWMHEHGYSKHIVPSDRAVTYHVKGFEHLRMKASDVGETQRDRQEMTSFRMALQDAENEVNTVVKEALK